jgi:hypothetical protein
VLALGTVLPDPLGHIDGNTSAAGIEGASTSNAVDGGTSALALVD